MRIWYAVTFKQWFNLLSAFRFINASEFIYCKSEV
jgi:phage anti-repressor protein